MRPFSLLIKPASADCNLRCQYCFYLEKGLLFKNSKHRMDDVTLETLIRTYLHTNQVEYGFNWQGGEPTLMGLDFYKKAVAYQNHYRPKGARITNSLQTNGTLLTDEWAEFLSKCQFLLGVSLDGPEHIHNKYRTFENKSSSYQQVINGIRNLQKHRVQYNILTLVSQANVCRPLEVYQYIRDELGCYFHQYIECVEYDAGGKRLPFTISAQEWGDFLCTIFDEWLKNDWQRISVRLFDSIVAILSGNPPTMCSFGKDCRHYLVVEHNGDIFPCDFFVENEFKIGNVNERSWGTLVGSPLYQQFGLNKQHWHSDCDMCNYLECCAGDCQKNRIGNTASTQAKSDLCQGWKQFYQHSLPEFRKLISKINMRNNMPHTSKTKSNNIGRNDPCYCGSGKKYKKCCLGKDSAK